MANLKEVDRPYAQKYFGRWILGKDILIGYPQAGDNVFYDPGDLIRGDDISVAMQILPLDSEPKPNDPSFAPNLGATPVYMDVSNARNLVDNLNKAVQKGRLEHLAEPILYDSDGKETLVAVHLVKDFESEDDMWNAKRELQDICARYDAQILSFDASKDREFLSTDFGKGLKFKGIENI